MYQAFIVQLLLAAGVFPEEKDVYFDHTSIGRYLCDKWGLKPLGERMRQASSIAAVLRPNDPPRLDVLPQIAPVPEAQPVTTPTPNENQVALNQLSKYLDQQVAGPSPARMFEAALDAKPDPDVMRSRVMRFLNRP
jgi:hypothetical protein